MKIETITVSPPEADEGPPDAEVTRLKVSGPIDPKDAVLVRARELVLATGSKAMLDSFDWALDSSAFVTDE